MSHSTTTTEATLSTLQAACDEMMANMLQARGRIRSLETTLASLLTVAREREDLAVRAAFYDALERLRLPGAGIGLAYDVDPTLIEQAQRLLRTERRAWRPRIISGGLVKPGAPAN